MLDLTVPQLDFILECYAQDNPKRFTFVRANKPVVSAPQTTASWFNVLRGKALQQFMGGRVNQAAIDAAKARAKAFGLRGKGKL